MFHVNLYTYTTIKGPGKKDGSFTYILEYITAVGPATVTKAGTMEKVTENQSELQIILQAMARLNKPCEVTIFTDCMYLKRGAEDWLPGWISADWKNARNKPVANAEEWKKVAELLGTHSITFKINEKHSYSSWIQTETEKKEEERKICIANSENLIQQKKSIN